MEINENRSFLYDYTEAQKVDTLSQKSGFSAQQLMGNAALASYLWLRNEEFQRIIFLCGGGNNGGDGLALAYYFATDYNLRVPKLYVCCTHNPSQSQTANFYLEKLVQKGSKIFTTQDFLSLELNENDIVIEALLGSGQKKRPRKDIWELLWQLRKFSSRNIPQKIISLDVPAGLCEENPMSFIPRSRRQAKSKLDENTLIAPDEIYCYHIDKLSLRLSSNLQAHSKTYVLPIGLDASFTTPSSWLSLGKLSSKSIYSYFQRDKEAHKYKAGHGLIIGGSRGMEGALLMASQSFFVAGGGILQAMVPEESSRELCTRKIPSVMFQQWDSLKDYKQEVPTILVGPGLSKEDFLSKKEELKAFLIRQKNSFIILDAYATTLILEDDFPRQRALLLPHTGEWKRLNQDPIVDTLSFYKSRKNHKKNIGAYTLLKDSICILFSQDNYCTLFPNPNPNLAVAGTGDNLSGLLLALLSKKVRVFSYPLIEEKIYFALALLHHSLDAYKYRYPRSDDFARAMGNYLSKANDVI